MIERDFIMRMVREVAQMLARVISKRAAGQYEEARGDLENICAQHTGLELDFVRSIAPDDLLEILKQSGGLFVSRCMTLAEILLEDARLREASGRGMETIPNYVHALKLLRATEGAVDDAARAELSQKVATIGGRLSELGIEIEQGAGEEGVIDD